MRALWLLLSISALSVAQPYINYRGVVNVASYAAPGLPAGSLARGSMVAVFGRNLGPAGGAQVSTFPLQPTFQNVSVTVSQQGTTVNALPVFVSAGQINAIIPSNAPMGRATIVVTVNNVRSNSATVNIVPVGFGAFAANSAGFGPGIIQNSGADVNSPVKTAKPGQTEVLWGTGLGPVAQDNTAPTPVNLPGRVEVFVGGQPALVRYAGRTNCCSSIDQINFDVPPNAPSGCYVPVVVRLSGQAISNTVTMSIDPNGAPCNDPANPLGAAFRSGGRFGAALLTHNAVSDPSTSFNLTADSASLTLRQEAANPWGFNPYTSLPPLGTCTAYGMAGDFPAVNDLLGTAPSLKDLSGGAISLKGAAGTVPLPATATQPTFFTALLATSQNIANVLTSFFTSGSVSTLTGSGGSDVGAFQANVTSSPPFAWSNQASLTTLTRANGFTVTWANPPASATGIVIAGFNVDVSNNASGGFLCWASPSSGSFTVPASVLGNIPATSAANTKKGWLIVGAPSLGSAAAFSASGLDQGLAVFANSSQQAVVYR